MNPKFEINNSNGYEYLIHGQDLQIKFKIPYSLFTFVIYKQVHTKLWFHKFLTGTYYVSPFVYFFNFLVNQRVPGFKNKNLLSTNFEYPGTSYKYNSIPDSVWDYRVKLRFSLGTINTFANAHHPTLLFLGIGWGFRMPRLDLNINYVDVIEEKFEESTSIDLPHIYNLSNSNLTTYQPINFKQATLSIKQSKLVNPTKQPQLYINSEHTTLELIN